MHDDFMIRAALAGVGTAAVTPCEGAGASRSASGPKRPTLSTLGPRLSFPVVAREIVTIWSSA